MRSKIVKDTVRISQMLRQVCGADSVFVNFQNFFFEALDAIYIVNIRCSAI
jgi:hypothetical protein